MPRKKAAPTVDSVFQQICELSELERMRLYGRLCRKDGPHPISTFVRWGKAAMEDLGTKVKEERRLLTTLNQFKKGPTTRRDDTEKRNKIIDGLIAEGKDDDAILKYLQLNHAELVHKKGKKKDQLGGTIDIESIMKKYRRSRSPAK